MKEKILYLILALLIYLPTCAYVPLSTYLVLILISIFLVKDFLLEFWKGLLSKKIIDKNFAVLLLVALFAMILRLVDYSNWESINDFYSFAYFFPFTYLVAKSLIGRTEVFKYIVLLVAIEVVLGIIQYTLGISSFFVNNENVYYEFSDYDLLYNTRVYGVSLNSSLLAEKIFIGILLVYILEFKNIILKNVIDLLFIVGIVLTFGRTTFIAVVCFVILKMIYSLIKKISIYDILKKNISFLVFFLLIILNINWAKYQFTRNNIDIIETRVDYSEDDFFSNIEHDNGKQNNTEKEDSEEVIGIDDITETIGIDQIEMGGRNEIWNSYYTYIKSHFHFGSFGKRYLIGRHHAHNTFLELLSTFGIYIFGLLMYLIIKNVNKKNFIFIAAFAILSLGQYFVFWGMSIFDIFFFYIVFFYLNEYTPENKRS